MSGTFCQSCGMPLTTEGLYGTEKDGAKNRDYCVYCYANGGFTQPDITMEEMMQICIPHMTKSGMSEDEAPSLLNASLPLLKRWKKAMVAFCGLDCALCEAFVATARNDDALRVKVAAEWAKAYNVPIKPEHINCTGCNSTGVKTYYCEQMCEIRKCAVERRFGTCAECSDFPCGKLDEVFKQAPQAKDTLTALLKK